MHEIDLQVLTRYRHLLRPHLRATIQMLECIFRNIEASMYQATSHYNRVIIRSLPDLLLLRRNLRLFVFGFFLSAFQNVELWYSLLSVQVRALIVLLSIQFQVIPRNEQENLSLLPTKIVLAPPLWPNIDISVFQIKLHLKRLKLNIHP